MRLYRFISFSAFFAFLAMPASAGAETLGYSEFKAGPEMTWMDRVAEGWDVSVGGGILLKPEFMGSEDYEIMPVPMIDARWENRLTINTREGVAYDVLQAPNYRVGGGLGYDFGRDDDDGEDNWLRGMGDIDATIEARAYGEYGWGPVWVEGEVAGDAISNGHEGMTATVALEYRQRSGQNLFVSFGPSLTWASEDYMQSYFGVDARQAAASRFGRYSADSGLRDYAFDGSAIYTFGSEGEWFASGFGRVSRLVGDAADSPVVQEEVQLSGGAAVGYRF